MYEECSVGIVNDVIYMAETDSTNNQAKELGSNGAVSGTLVVAGKQSAGRGRRGRSWLSADEDGVWMSILLRPDIKPEYASMLTLVAALAVADAVDIVLDGITKEKCLIKWPNDIIIGDRKLCGILTEMSAKPGCVDYVVIGIGINVNTKVFDDSVKDMATSLYIQCGKFIDKAEIIRSWSMSFEKYYGKFLEKCDLSQLVDEYNSRLVNIGKMVKVEVAGNIRTGKALGIDATGALRVEFEEGSVENITAGEVSVRGLYGYV